MKKIVALLLMVVLTSCVNTPTELPELIVLQSIPGYDNPEKFKYSGYHEVSAVVEVDPKILEEAKANRNAIYIERINNTIYFSVKSAKKIDRVEDDGKEWVPILERYKVKIPKPRPEK